MKLTKWIRKFFCKHHWVKGYAGEPAEWVITYCPKCGQIPEDLGLDEKDSIIHEEEV